MKDSSKERKLQEESLEQLGKYEMNKCVPSIIIIEVSKGESSKKGMLQEERSNCIRKYYYI